MPVTLRSLRRYAINHSLFEPTTLPRALQKMGFVQADPIRSPARAQDLTLRHRVRDYRAGDLERRYQKIDVSEDVFINYGFVTRSLQNLMHPRSRSDVPAAGQQEWPEEKQERAQRLLEFVVERGVVHPREVEAHFSHGKVTNYWGGSSHSTTHLLDAMHYRGMLRVAYREAGIRLYQASEHPAEFPDQAQVRSRIDALADVAVRIYAPMPRPSLSFLLRRLRYAAPQWRGELTAAIRRAMERLSHARVDGMDWYWPAESDVLDHSAPPVVRLLAPFDPVVWDRARFELFWGWQYRFEAYTPARKRTRGYYALPLLWRDRVIGWGNLSLQDGELVADVGYVASPPKERTFKRELDAELDRIRRFLKLDI